MTRPDEETGFDDYLVVSIAGFDRDDPGQPDGLCRPQDESTPESFVLAFGSITLQVPNSDPTANTADGAAQAVVGCHGNVFLETVTRPRH